jgi:hypothetical protein
MIIIGNVDPNDSSFVNALDLNASENINVKKKLLEKQKRLNLLCNFSIFVFLIMLIWENILRIWVPP